MASNAASKRPMVSVHFVIAKGKFSRRVFFSSLILSAAVMAGLPDQFRFASQSQIPSSYNVVLDMATRPSGGRAKSAWRATSGLQVPEGLPGSTAMGEPTTEPSVMFDSPPWALAFPWASTKGRAWARVRAPRGGALAGGLTIQARQLNGQRRRQTTCDDYLRPDAG